MPPNFDPSKFPRLQVRKTLLVIDAQNEFLSKDGLLAVQDCDKLSSDIAHLVSRFRSIGDVIWVRSEFKAQEKYAPHHIVTSTGESAPETDPEAFLTYKFNERPCVARGTSACDMPDVLKEALDERTDVVITKNYYSAFKQTGLVERLRQHIAFELYLCGSLANIGVFATSVDATPHGTTVNIIQDCCGWREKERLKLAFKKLDQIYACCLINSDSLFRETLPISSLGHSGSTSNSSSAAPRTRVQRAIGRPSKRSSGKSGSKAKDHLDKTPDITESLQNLSLNSSGHGDEITKHKICESSDKTPVSKTSSEFEIVLESALKASPGDNDKPKPTPSTPGKNSEGAVLEKPVLEGSDIPQPTSVVTKEDHDKNESLDELAALLDDVVIGVKGDATAKDVESAPANPKQLTSSGGTSGTPLLTEDEEKPVSSEALSLEEQLPVKSSKANMPGEAKKNNGAGETDTTCMADKTTKVVESAKTSDLAKDEIVGEEKAKPEIDKPEAVPSEAVKPDAPKSKATKPKAANTPESKAGFNGSPDKKPLHSPQEQPLRLCEGDTTVVENLLDAHVADEAFNTLKEEVQWASMTHRSGEVPRRIAVQGAIAKDGSKPLYRHPADESLPLLPFSPTVLRLKEAVETHLGHHVNHVLIQYYRSGHDYISEHSDKTLDIARTSYIANLSLGAQRTMVFRSKRTVKIRSGDTASKGEPEIAGEVEIKGEGMPRRVERAALPHNSLLRMGLYTNKHWLHGIRPDKRADVDKDEAAKAFGGGRISLTFRLIATFLSADETSIWGQGATGKTKAAAGKVMNGDRDATEKLVLAFGRENQDPWFDWDEAYEGGSDVLHMKLDNESVEAESQEKPQEKSKEKPQAKETRETPRETIKNTEGQTEVLQPKSTLAKDLETTNERITIT
ncbi:hypothetical protein CFIMG_004477RAa [Ceratocystis fimbriata CBS 114723]|uniref:Fe2OG dioxygenase domain-containing protein n=1 Tax=Ceratocystis fimbriata CBS 114723 TaxID=1035309 RepID=A0A2C5WP36_9PEZI|nr:hypothetical protein CFIMG_004477RAa [Ceratocystis fimbriata CBS 114723]